MKVGSAIALVVSASWFTAAHAEPPGDGVDWQAASPWETDAAKLCGAIDPPMASRRWASSVSFENARDCHQRIGVQASDLQAKPTQVKSRNSEEIDAKVSACLSAMQVKPYTFIGFSPDAACARFDEYIDSDSRVVNTVKNARVEEWSRARIARNQNYRAECLKRTRAAVASARAARSASASSAAVGMLRDIPPAERVPEEAALVAASVDACKAEAKRRRDERVSTAATRDVAELRAITPSFLLPEERARIADADAERVAADAEHAAVVERRRVDPKWMGPLLSASICVATEKKGIAAKEIQTEQAYARRYGGVVDNSKIYDLQNQIRRIDNNMANARRVLRQLKASQRGCEVEPVRQIAACASQGGGEGDPRCATAQIREYLELADD